jgi:GGDEF domain-containing protein
MPLVRWISNALLCVCTVLLTCASLAAQANAAPKWEITVYSGAATAESLTAARLAAKPERRFTPFNPSTIHATGLQNHVWLRVRVSSEQEINADTWLIGISKPFADKVVLHTKASNGIWTEQAAGDWMAHRSWPVRSLTPQFFIPAQPKGSQDIYLEVRNRTPLRFEVNVLSAAAAIIESQNNFFLIGLAIGLMLLMTIASGVLTAAYRDMVYVWYGIYVITNILVSLAYSGLAAYALWPDATSWPEMSITVLFMVGNVLQLQFYRAMFFNAATPIWIRRAVLGVIVLGLFTIALNMYAIQNLGSSAVFTLHVLAFTSLSFIIITSQFSAKNSESWLYMLSCLPLTLVGWLAVLENAGWLALTWLPYNAPIYAFAIEMPILFAAIYMHAKSEHALTVRKSTLASTDPTTGFVSRSQHMDTFAQAWDSAKKNKHDTVVAYVKVSHQLDHMTTIGGPGRARSVERAVHLLRTVVRENDTVTHVDTDLFAILMPDMSLGAGLTDRLARLVALAVMTDQDAARDVPLRFRIVAGSRGSFQGTAAKLHRALQHKLSASDWGPRAIRYVRNRSAKGVRANSSQPDETLSQFWERAVQDENSPDTVQDTLQEGLTPPIVRQA